MRVAITVREQDMRGERTVEVRRVSTQSARRLTATRASQILRHEFPELPRRVARALAQLVWLESKPRIAL